MQRGIRPPAGRAGLARHRRQVTAPSGRQHHGAPSRRHPLRADPGPRGPRPLRPRLERCLGKLTAALGPSTGWLNAAASARRAAAALTLADRGVLGPGLVRAAEHMGELVTHADPALIEELAGNALAATRSGDPGLPRSPGGDAQGLARPPGLGRRDSGDAPRPSPDRALPAGPAAGALRRPARGSRLPLRAGPRIARSRRRGIESPAQTSEEEREWRANRRRS